VLYELFEASPLTPSHTFLFEYGSSHEVQCNMLSEYCIHSTCSWYNSLLLLTGFFIMLCISCTKYNFVSNLLNWKTNNWNRKST